MQNKKTAINCYQAYKEKLQKRSPEYYRNLSKDEKLKKEIILTVKIKMFQTEIEKEKKEYMRNYYYKRKNSLII